MKSLADILFVRKNHVCPWYICFTFDNFLRRWVQDPYQIIKEFIKTGDTVVDIGPGQGYFTIPMAHIVGPAGRIFAIDIQQKMLDLLKAKALSAGVDDRITYLLNSNGTMNVPVMADFVLAFWMVHEVPDKEQFLKNVYTLLKSGGRLLIAEPLFHVSMEMMEQTVHTAVNNGFFINDTPKYFFSRAVTFQK